MHRKFTAEMAVITTQNPSQVVMTASLARQGSKEELQEIKTIQTLKRLHPLFDDKATKEQMALYKNSELILQEIYLQIVEVMKTLRSHFREDYYQILEKLLTPGHQLHELSEQLEEFFENGITDGSLDYNPQWLFEQSFLTHFNSTTYASYPAALIVFEKSHPTTSNPIIAYKKQLQAKTWAAISLLQANDTYLQQLAEDPALSASLINYLQQENFLKVLQLLIPLREKDSPFKIVFQKDELQPFKERAITIIETPARFSSDLREQALVLTLISEAYKYEEKIFKAAQQKVLLVSQQVSCMENKTPAQKTREEENDQIRQLWAAVQADNPEIFKKYCTQDLDLDTVNPYCFDNEVLLDEKAGETNRHVIYVKKSADGFFVYRVDGKRPVRDIKTNIPAPDPLTSDSLRPYISRLQQEAGNMAYVHPSNDTLLILILKMKSEKCLQLLLQMHRALVLKQFTKPLFLKMLKPLAENGTLKAKLEYPWLEIKLGETTVFREVCDSQLQMPLLKIFNLDLRFQVELEAERRSVEQALQASLPEAKKEHQKNIQDALKADNAVKLKDHLRDEDLSADLIHQAVEQNKSNCLVALVERCSAAGRADLLNSEDGWGLLGGRTPAKKAVDLKHETCLTALFFVPAVKAAYQKKYQPETTGRRLR